MNPPKKLTGMHWHIWNLFPAEEPPLQALVLPSQQSSTSRCPRDLLIQQQNWCKHLRSPIPTANEMKHGYLKSCRRENSSSLAYNIRDLVQKTYTKSISMMKIDFSPFLFSYRKRWIMCFIWPIKRHKSIHFIIKIIHIFITTSHRK